MAARFSSVSVVKVILDAGLDINVRDDDDRIPLHYALRHNNVDVGARDDVERTHLDVAAQQSGVDVLRLLID